MAFSLSSTGGDGWGEEAIWNLVIGASLGFGIWSFPRSVHGKSQFEGFVH
jgi:hypothetical protein